MAPVRTCQIRAGERARIIRPQRLLASMAAVGGLLLAMTGFAAADCDPERAPTVCNPVRPSSQPAAGPSAGARKTHDQAGRRDRNKSARTAAKLPLPSVVPVLSSPPSVSAAKELSRTRIVDDESRAASGVLLRLWLGITVVLFVIFECLYRYAPLGNLRNISLYLRWCVFRWRQWRFEGGGSAVSWLTSPFRDPTGRSPA